tara:strand:- start:409 stop:1503 length:1095 start_codon:yes stop_codon:yes gene_type:complete
MNYNLKVVNIGHYINRTGTLFLHSLLDNHPQILTVPGVLNFNYILNNNISSSEEALELFENENPKFFDTSSFNILDKNNSQLFYLGEKKKSKIITNKIIFKETFIKVLKEFGDLSKSNIIKSVYLAYAISHNQKIDEKKILLLHPHEQKICIEFNKLFPSSKFLIPIRNPIKVYFSLIETRRAKCKLRDIPYYPRGSFKEFIEGLNNFKINNLNMHVIRLEDLGNKTEDTMKKICEFINIEFNKSLLTSTFGGYKYWGNTINLQRNNYFEKNYDSFEKAKKNDLELLKILNMKILKKFYTEIDLSKINKNSLYKIIKPLNDEIIFIRDFKIKYLSTYLKFLLFYIPKRIFLIFKLIRCDFINDK